MSGPLINKWMDSHIMALTPQPASEYWAMYSMCSGILVYVHALLFMDVRRIRHGLAADHRSGRAHWGRYVHRLLW